MKVKSRPLNNGECFPCSMKKAKEIFADANVELDFSSVSRIYGTFKNTFDMYYLKNNIKGQVIASMYMYPKYNLPSLHFYVLKKQNYPEEIRREFEEDYLKLYLDFYNEMMNTTAPYICHVMLTEYRDGKLVLHRFKND